MAAPIDGNVWSVVALKFQRCDHQDTKSAIKATKQQSLRSSRNITLLSKNCITSSHGQKLEEREEFCSFYFFDFHSTNNKYNTVFKQDSTIVMNTHKINPTYLPYLIFSRNSKQTYFLVWPKYIQKSVQYQNPIQ